VKITLPKNSPQRELNKCRMYKLNYLIHEIINLRNHIKQGEELAKQGYPTEMLNFVNRELLKGLQAITQKAKVI
jgi:hypothetical protein